MKLLLLCDQSALSSVEPIAAGLSACCWCVSVKTDLPGILLAERPDVILSVNSPAHLLRVASVAKTLWSCSLVDLSHDFAPGTTMAGLDEKLRRIAYDRPSKAPKIRARVPVRP